MNSEPPSLDAATLRWVAVYCVALADDVAKRRDKLARGTDRKQNDAVYLAFIGLANELRLRSKEAEKNASGIVLP